MDLTSILVQAVSGAVGGNVGGQIKKQQNPGGLLNTIIAHSVMRSGMRQRGRQGLLVSSAWCSR
jgi:hypothetical protein